MADAEKNLKIGINIATTKTGPGAVKELDDVKKAATDAGKEGVKQEAAVEEATQKTFASKRDLKSMVKQLGHEFPILGQVGRLALNPIAAASAGIVASFVIWNKRLQELTRSLGGIEMPDVSDDVTKSINLQADAWGRVAEKMAEAKTHAKEFKTEFEATVATIKANDELAKALGLKTGTKALQQEAAATATQASRIESDARARLKSAGNPPSVERENDIQAKLDELANAAREEIKKAQDRIKKLENYRDRLPFVDAEDFEPYIQSEKGIIAGQQQIIDKSARFAKVRKSNEVRRNEIADANKDLASVTGLDDKVLSLLQQIAINTAQDATGGKALGGPPNVMADPAGFALWMRGMAELSMKMPAIIKSIMEANRYADALNSKQKDGLLR